MRTLLVSAVSTFVVAASSVSSARAAESFKVQFMNPSTERHRITIHLGCARGVDREIQIEPRSTRTVSWSANNGGTCATKSKTVELSISKAKVSWLAAPKFITPLLPPLPTVPAFKSHPFVGPGLKHYARHLGFVIERLGNPKGPDKLIIFDGGYDPHANAKVDAKADHSDLKDLTVPGDHADDSDPPEMKKDADGAHKE